MARARTIEFVDKLSELPSVHETLARLSPECARFPHRVTVEAVRRALEEARARIRENTNGADAPVEQRAAEVLLALERPSQVRVVNATGVVLHTNLGRAPLGLIDPLRGYSNLEYDLPTGRRG